MKNNAVNLTQMYMMSRVSYMRGEIEKVTGKIKDGTFDSSARELDDMDMLIGLSKVCIGAARYWFRRNLENYRVWDGLVATLFNGADLLKGKDSDEYWEFVRRENERMSLQSAINFI